MRPGTSHHGSVHVEDEDELICDDTTPLRPAPSSDFDEDAAVKARTRVAAVKGILAKSASKTRLELDDSSEPAQRGEIEMRRLVWADEATQGAQPLEQEFVIPSRPMRLRRNLQAAAQPSFCILVMFCIAIFLFWKALSTRKT